MNRLIYFIFLIPLYILADGVSLYNDTPFELTATVEAADGTLLGQITIQPGVQQNWTENQAFALNVPQKPTASVTPYRVIWKCNEGDVFALCSWVSPGSDVRASLCPGQHFCKQKDKKTQSSPSNCPPCEKASK